MTIDFVDVLSPVLTVWAARLVLYSEWVYITLAPRRRRYWLAATSAPDAAAQTHIDLASMYLLLLSLRHVVLAALMIRA